MPACARMHTDVQFPLAIGHSQAPARVPATHSSSHSHSNGQAPHWTHTHTHTSALTAQYRGKACAPESTRADAMTLRRGNRCQVSTCMQPGRPDASPVP